MIKLDALLVILGLGIQIYAIIDVARKPQESFVVWQKWVWLLVVIIISTILVPIGPLIWIFWGRKRNGGTNGPKRPRQPKDIPPDDNPDFLRNL